MNRRAFTFASLALAGTAAAGELDSIGGQAATPVKARVAAAWTVSAKGGELVVKLALTNVSSEALDVLVARGSRPGPHLEAALQVDGEDIALARIDEGDRRELMSRMGPMPRWEPVAAGGRVEIGPYKFTLPKGATGENVRLTAYVEAGGESVTFEYAGRPAQV